MDNVCCLILAAGEGKRMKSDKPKVLSEVLFKPMIHWVIDSVNAVGIEDVCVVSGFKREILSKELKENNYNFEEAVQKEQKGTAHAVMSAESFLIAHKGYDVIILNGDAPFIDRETILNSLFSHRKHTDSATVITAHIDEPFGYGRIVRDEESGMLKEIVEQKDASDSQLKIKEVNSGAYWFNVDDLLSALEKVGNKNAQGEYYLTDTLSILLDDGHNVKAFTTDNPDVILGANDVGQLSELNEIARNKVIDDFSKKGVLFPCRDGIIISPDVNIEEKCTILPSTVIKGKTEIKKYCTVGPNSVIIDCVVEENINLCSVYAFNKKFEKGEEVKPFSVFNA